MNLHLFASSSLLSPPSLYSLALHPTPISVVIHSLFPVALYLFVRKLENGNTKSKEFFSGRMKCADDMMLITCWSRGIGSHDAHVKLPEGCFASWCWDHLESQIWSNLDILFMEVCEEAEVMSHENIGHNFNIWDPSWLVNPSCAVKLDISQVVIEWKSPSITRSFMHDFENIEVCWRMMSSKLQRQIYLLNPAESTPVNHNRPSPSSETKIPVVILISNTFLRQRNSTPMLALQNEQNLFLCVFRVTLHSTPVSFRSPSVLVLMMMTTTRSAPPSDNPRYIYWAAIPLLMNWKNMT